jgi:hypothetical protein
LKAALHKLNGSKDKTVGKASEHPSHQVLVEGALLPDLQAHHALGEFKACEDYGVNQRDRE